MRFAAYREGAAARVDRRLDALMADEDKALREALGPALAGGKRFRPAVLLLVHDALGGTSPARAEAWAVAMELMHTATLIHDDLVDGDDQRRGAPATHLRLRRALAGMATRPDARTDARGLAALAGDAALAWGFALLGDPAAAQRAGVALREVWRGAWHEALPATGPGDEQVARLKTASLFRLACELGALAASAPAPAEQAARAYGEHLGLAYQWADDAADGPAAAAGELRSRALWEADHARSAAAAFPPGPYRACLVEAPLDLLRAVLPEASP